MPLLTERPFVNFPFLYPHLKKLDSTEKEYIKKMFEKRSDGEDFLGIQGFSSFMEENGLHTDRINDLFR